MKPAVWLSNTNNPLFCSVQFLAFSSVCRFSSLNFKWTSEKTRQPISNYEPPRWVVTFATLLLWTKLCSQTKSSTNVLNKKIFSIVCFVASLRHIGFMRTFWCDVIEACIASEVISGFRRNIRPVINRWASARQVISECWNIFLFPMKCFCLILILNLHIISTCFKSYTMVKFYVDIILIWVMSANPCGIVWSSCHTPALARVRIV